MFSLVQTLMKLMTFLVLLSLFPIYRLSYLFIYCMAYREEKPELSSGLSLGITGNDSAAIHQTKQHLGKQFHMKDLGPL